MPDVDSTLRHIAKWKYIIVSDLTSAFYQIPLSQESMKYCGVVTPFRGVRVYTRSAMGIRGSETALEELMSHVLVTYYKMALLQSLRMICIVEATLLRNCYKTGIDCYKPSIIVE